MSSGAEGLSEPEAIEQISSKNNIRTRVQPTTGASLIDRAFASLGGSASSNPTYGSTSTSSHGNFLIDDEEVSQIATSDSVKGLSLIHI